MISCVVCWIDFLIFFMKISLMIFQELNTALHWGAFTGNEDIIALFLDAGCFIDDVNDHGDTPMLVSPLSDYT